MAAFFASLSATEALATAFFGPGLFLIGGSFLVVEAGRFVRLALRGR